ncbi:MAG: hypothetical protein LUC41_04745 [Clostridiales bacterium]|nr:hypothetical protein [Clostridiales bacterium]
MTRVKENSSITTLSLKDARNNKIGYFNRKNYPDTKDFPRITGQNLYQRKKTRSNSSTPEYSISLLPEADIYNIPNAYSTAYDFLFFTSTTHYIDNNLTSSKNRNDASCRIWNNYVKLDAEYSERKNGVIPAGRKDKDENKGDDTELIIGSFPAYKLNGADFLLYSAPLEFWYGFSSFRYILRTVNEIDDPTPDSRSRTLADFDGEPIRILSNTMLKSRLVFSRHFFLDYAIFSIANSRDLESSYFTRKSSVMMSKMPAYDDSSKEIRLSNALSLTRQYWDALTKITIPVLEDAWSVCISKWLDDSGKNNEYIVNMYKEYIDENIDILTADYSRFSLSELRSSLNDLRSSLKAAENRKPNSSNNTNPKNAGRSFATTGLRESINLEKLQQIIRQNNSSTLLKNMYSKPSRREMMCSLLNEYLSKNSSRFKEDSHLPGYINNDPFIPTTSSMEIKEYFREMFLRRIQLYGKRPD